MTPRTTLAALAVASLSMLPTLASGAIVQKWQSPGGASGYALMAQVGDITNDGIYDLITVEPTLRVALRSGATGALVAQSAGTYMPSDEFWIANVDADEDAEIIFRDSNTLICLQYNGTSTLAVRWSYLPTPTGFPTTWEFADLDGNGQLYSVFKDDFNYTNWYVRDNNGVLVTTINLATAPSGAGWTRDFFVDDYDLDGRHEILIQYRKSLAPDALYVFESNAPAAPGASLTPEVSEPRTFRRGTLVVEPPLPLATRPVYPAQDGR